MVAVFTKNVFIIFINFLKSLHYAIIVRIFYHSVFMIDLHTKSDFVRMNIPCV